MAKLQTTKQTANAEIAEHTHTLHANNNFSWAVPDYDAIHEQVTEQQLEHHNSKWMRIFYGPTYACMVVANPPSMPQQTVSKIDYKLKESFSSVYVQFESKFPS